MVDLVKRFPMSIWLQKSASIQTRTSLLKFEDRRFCKSQFRSHAEPLVEGSLEEPDRELELERARSISSSREFERRGDSLRELLCASGHSDLSPSSANLWSADSPRIWCFMDFNPFHMRNEKH